MALKEKRLKGIAVSSGIAMGDLRVELRGTVTPTAHIIPQEEREDEWQRFEDALDKTQTELEEIIKRVEEQSGAYEAAIFDAHLLFLRDRTIMQRVRKDFDARSESIDSIYFNVVQNFMDVVRHLENAYLRSRVVDMEDVLRRVIKKLSKSPLAWNEEGGNQTPCILAAHDLTPSDTADMDRSLILGFVTEAGSAVSHTAILARSVGLPAIVAVPELMTVIRSGQKIILDGYSGTIILNPSVETLAHYEHLQEEKNRAYQNLVDMKDLPAETLDGRRIRLAANVEFAYEYKSLQDAGAEGVGLYRTEFFLLGQGELPNEETQYKHYKELVEACSPHEVIFRTLDAGGDKLPFEDTLDKEDNPFLGWRGIRVSLQCRDFFKEQLRAIMRASAHGQVGVMFPMISGIFEVLTIRELLEECRQELINAGHAFDPSMKVGVMIEVPSAAMIADTLAPYVDFFSIGTNDLTQYTIAVDRVNHKVASMFRPAHPAVIRLMSMTIESGVPTAICGEMGSDLTLIPLLVGLGAHELSLGTHMMPLVRYAIRNLNYEECRAMAQEALKQPSSLDIRALSQAIAERSYPILFH